jgi:hypothetical protein
MLYITIDSHRKNVCNHLFTSQKWKLHNQMWQNQKIVYVILEKTNVGQLYSF